MDILFSELQLDKSELTPDQLSQVKTLVIEYEDIFSQDDFDIGRSTLVQHEIHTGDATPDTD
jgi:hypothetical protein